MEGISQAQELAYCYSWGMKTPIVKILYPNTPVPFDAYFNYFFFQFQPPVITTTNESMSDRQNLYFSENLFGRI